MKVEQVWERRSDFLALNPAGEVPVLVEVKKTLKNESIEKFPHIYEKAIIEKEKECARVAGCRVLEDGTIEW